MLKLLIFDLDGTLADTSRDIADAINYALRPFGQRTFS
ncbi:MAG: HAD hydrolase-like protein, partial [Candidatus Aenigmarchaeota archaeon]|nr:HAD hydrolase-like protein [Candidatus Aenigmarchaeota archaeon]